MSKSQLHCDPSLYIPPDKWKQWYPFAATSLEVATAYCIEALYSANLTFYHTQDPLSPRNCPDGYEMMTCVQNNTTASTQANFASAQVLLGLTPALLSLLAPTIGELSILSSSRPVLGFLLSIGCPTVFSARVLGYDDPLEALIRRISPKDDPSHSRYRRRDNGAPMIGRRINGPTLGDKFICLMEYLLVLACVANVTTNSLQLGFQTILVWKVNSDYMAVLWSTLAAVVHLTATVPWYHSRTMRNLRSAERCTEEAAGGYVSRSLRRFTRSLVREATVCAAHQPRGYIDYGCFEGIVIHIWNRAASFTAFLLVIFGTAVMSSLLFITQLDALGVVARYIVSTLVCRLVLMYELAGLAAVECEGIAGRDDTSEQKYT